MDVLESVIGSPGRSRFHEARFREQERGDSTYLIAWLDGAPVGHLNLRWTGSHDEPVAAVYPGVPEVNALGVWPPELQGRGVGRRLIAVAETLATEKGLDRIGLGVGVDNPRACQLYERLGYVDWGRGTVVGSWDVILDDGTVIQQSEESTYMVKTLSPADA